MTSKKSALKNTAASASDEQTFHLIFEKHAAVMLLIEPETGKILNANQAAVDFYGYPKSELCGMAISKINILPPEQVAAARQKALGGEQNYSIFPHRLASGEVRTVEVNSSPIVWQEKRILFSIIHDITERKQAEDAQRISEAKYQAIVENAPVGIFQSTPQGRFRSVNPLMARIYGYDSPEDMVASVTNISSQIYVNASERLEFQRVLAKHGEYTGFVSKNYRKDGAVIWTQTTARTVKDAQENILYYEGFITDVTARKQAEDALRESEKKYRLIAENTSDGIIIFGADNHIKYASPAYASQLGYGEMEELARTPEIIYSAIHADDRDIVFSNIYEAIRLKKNELTYSYRVKHKTGHYIWREDNATFNYDHSGNYSGANVICRDITDRKQAEEATRQRVMELETLNRISLVLRAVSKQEEMLSIVLDEALAILNTPHGSIELHNKATDNLDQIILRGWITKVTTPHPIGEGIAGKVFTSGEIYISREFASDPETRPAARGQIPSGWGGICLPIRTTQQTLGILIVSVPDKRELDKDEIRLLATLTEMTGAALQRMQLHAQTVRRLEQLHALHAVDQAISSSRDLPLTLNILLTHTIAQLGVDAADVLLLHSCSNLLELLAEIGFHTLLFENIKLNDSVAGRVIMEHRSVMTLDLEIINQHPQFKKFWKEEGFTCYWCVPLVVKGEVKGVLEVYRRAAFTPDAEWIEFLEALASQAAIAIDSIQLFENLQRANLDLSLAYDATIEGWSRAMDLRDHETEGHTLRVTDLVLKLARVMQTSESQLTAIRRGALLHDIGKMGVPDAILLKEGKLTEEEWVLMRKHPQFAYDMLAPIAYLNDALDIPYCHHEKWDGSGYPRQLAGGQIPLAARMFAVVDVWDALTSNRAYRAGWSKEKTLAYIIDQTGIYFDPQVVQAFLKII